ncbi:MAG: 50S ribosomal protein L11 methyltransferase [Deltaproteobacteria bacterium]|nr:50S ribosomal protein L11 methyltransferase [Deltaproteobacteria bacterium]
MAAEQTWELLIQLRGEDKEGTKTALISWLHAHGVDSFVEGAVDDLDIDHEEPDLSRDFYGESGGDSSPLSVYSYDQTYLTEIMTQLEASFREAIDCQILSMETAMWQENWKQGFRPIPTRRFYVYPPWESPEAAGERIPVLIDPGMAFGTGQHASTRLCLEMIENQFPPPDLLRQEHKRFLDVGAGSGILTIAALKSGFLSADACDIDPNAVIACRQNAEANHVSFDIRQGCLSTEAPPQPYDCVVANILFVVLSGLSSELAIHVKEGGILILSGLLSHQRADMLALMEAEKFSLVAENTSDDWLCLCLRKNPL